MELLIGSGGMKDLYQVSLTELLIGWMPFSNVASFRGLRCIDILFPLKR